MLDNLGCASSIDATPLEVAGSRNVVLRLILKFDKDVLLEGLRMSVGGGSSACRARVAVLPTNRLVSCGSDAVAEGVKQHLAGAADWSFDMQGFSSLPLPELSSAKEPSAGKVAVSMDASITHPTFDVVDECESQTAFTSCSDFAAAVVDRVVGRQRNAVRKDLELAFQNDAARDAMVDGQSWLEVSMCRSSLHRGCCAPDACLTGAAHDRGAHADGLGPRSLQWVHVGASPAELAARRRRRAARSSRGCPKQSRRNYERRRRGGQRRCNSRGS